ncbi:MAG: hypothetical protein Q4A42_04690 [Tissierellia bacterium]|nr:hypothetical protein [Tissierellia bacterium]
MKVKVCMGTNCVMNGSMELFDQIASLNDLILANPEEYSVESIETEAIKCNKICKSDDFKKCVVYVDDELLDVKRSQVLENIMKRIKI